MAAITATGMAEQSGRRDLATEAAKRAVAGEGAGQVLPFNTVSRGSKTGELTTAQQFESFVLQSFIEPMLPKEDSAYFGEETGGAIWRSMLAERIGAEMAASGGIGIAAMVEKRDASAEALTEAKDALAKNDAAARGAALGKPGAL